jgi:hypothetical protein
LDSVCLQPTRRCSSVCSQIAPHQRELCPVRPRNPGLP